MKLSATGEGAVPLTKLSATLSFAQFAQEKVQAVVNPQPTLETNTITQLWGFNYIQALLNRLIQNKMSTTSVSELGYLFLTSPVCNRIASDLDVGDHTVSWMIILG